MITSENIYNLLYNKIICIIHRIIKNATVDVMNVFI